MFFVRYLKNAADTFTKNVRQEIFKNHALRDLIWRDKHEDKQQNKNDEEKKSSSGSLE